MNEEERRESKREGEREAEEEGEKEPGSQLMGQNRFFFKDDNMCLVKISIRLGAVLSTHGEASLWSKDISPHSHTEFEMDVKYTSGITESCLVEIKAIHKYQSQIFLI